MEDLVMPRKLWEHRCPEETQMYEFKLAFEKRTGKTFSVCEPSRSVLRHPCFDQLQLLSLCKLSLPNLIGHHIPWSR